MNETTQNYINSKEFKIKLTNLLEIIEMLNDDQKEKLIDIIDEKIKTAYKLLFLINEHKPSLNQLSQFSNLTYQSVLLYIQALKKHQFLTNNRRSRNEILEIDRHTSIFF